MSFPHRTGYHDDKKNEIYLFDDINCIDENGQIIVNGEHHDIYTSRYTPLASTGLEDSEGNEVFDGHTVRLSSGDIYVVHWSNGEFLVGREIGRGIKAKPQVESHEIFSHALTDPDLVPESFDVEEYFGLGKK
jgi:hypothetical protein